MCEVGHVEVAGPMLRLATSTTTTVPNLMRLPGSQHYQGWLGAKVYAHSGLWQARESFEASRLMEVHVRQYRGRMSSRSGTASLTIVMERSSETFQNSSQPLALATASFPVSPLHARSILLLKLSIDCWVVLPFSFSSRLIRT